MSSLPTFDNLHEFIDITDLSDIDVQSGNFCPACNRRGNKSHVQNEHIIHDAVDDMFLAVSGCSACYGSRMDIWTIKTNASRIHDMKMEVSTFPGHKNLHEFVDVTDLSDIDVQKKNFCPLCNKRGGEIKEWSDWVFGLDGMEFITVLGCETCHKSTRNALMIMEMAERISDLKLERKNMAMTCLLMAGNALGIDVIPSHVLNCIIAYDAGIPNAGDILN